MVFHGKPYFLRFKGGSKHLPGGGPIFFGGGGGGSKC